MPITQLAKLARLQIQYMQAGQLSYPGMKTLRTDALKGHMVGEFQHNHCYPD